ncbi:MAG: putative secreted protein [Thermoleophilia bacterium]|nr:putative secreted protein [Thermoleophilia bacterium]
MTHQIHDPAAALTMDSRTVPQQYWPAGWMPHPSGSWVPAPDAASPWVVAHQQHAPAPVTYEVAAPAPRVVSNRLFAGAVLAVVALVVATTWVTTSVLDRGSDSAGRAGTSASASQLLGATSLGSGEFRNVAKSVSGTAQVIGLGDGRRMLALRGFTSEMGPDLHVYLASGASPMGASVHLGKLRSLTGDQLYAIPAGTDLAANSTVLIWCREAKATFGAAALDLTERDLAPGDTSNLGGMMSPSNMMASSTSAEEAASEVSWGDLEPATGHETSGSAQLVRLGEGRYRLLMSNFHTDPGPDLNVYLASGSTLGGDSVRLGRVQRVDGSLSYDVPAGADLDQLTNVLVWCRVAKATFGTAPLTKSVMLA